MLDLNVLLPAGEGDTTALNRGVYLQWGFVRGTEQYTALLLCEEILSTKIDATGLSKSIGCVL